MTPAPSTEDEVVRTLNDAADRIEAIADRLTPVVAGLAEVVYAMRVTTDGSLRWERQVRNEWGDEVFEDVFGGVKEAAPKPTDKETN